jgi:hypothetical protein
MAGEFGNPEVVQEEVDILFIGGGMACCGAAYEVMRWADAAKAETGIDLKIKLVDKAAMDRSGAVAQGLSAINTYIGTEQDPADYARMALRAISDVENTLAAGATLAERNQILQRTVADNQRALELTQTRFRVGQSDLRTVRQQELEVYAARLALLRVQSEQLAQRVNLHLALGGDFTGPPEPAASR